MKYIGELIDASFVFQSTNLSGRDVELLMSSAFPETGRRHSGLWHSKYCLFVFVF